MPQFVLKITLGNDAMQTGYDIAGALKNTARTLELFPQEMHEGHIIRDINGNTVGLWRVK